MAPWYSFRNGPFNHGASHAPTISKDGAATATFVGGIIWGTCVIDAEDSLYVGSSSGKFFKIDNKGEIVWVYNLVSKTDSLVDSAAVIHPLGFVVVPGGDGFLHALNMKTGELIWRLKAPHNVDDKVDRSGVVVNSFEGNVQVHPGTGVLYAGCDNSNFYAVRPDGKELWSIKTDMMIWSCAAFMGTEGEMVVFGCLDHHLYLVDSSTGQLYGKYNTGAEIKSSPLVTRVKGMDYVYICNSNGKLSCFLLYNKLLQLVWQHDFGAEIYATPAYKDGKLILCTFDGRIISIACEENSPRVAWSHNVYNPICASPIITGDDLVIVADSLGVLYKLKLESGLIEGCTKISRHAFRTNLNASPAMDSKGVIHIGGYDGFIHHISNIKMSQDPVPRFIRTGRSHLELEYDGMFIKAYRARVFGPDGKYIENASIDVNSISGEKVITSSDGKYVNFIQTPRDPINREFACKFYDQTNSWFKDRVQRDIPDSKVVQPIQHTFDCMGAGAVGMPLETTTVLSWDVQDLAVFQPKILDTYVPAALDSVTYKFFVFANPLNSKTTGVADACVVEEADCFSKNKKEAKTQQVTCVMIPSVKNHEKNDSLIVIPEAQKVLLLDAEYDGNTIIARSRGPFEFSSMGGSMKFSKFDVYMNIDPRSMEMKSEFVMSSSCLSIKGNDDSYQFSSEIVNQLCDPFMNIYSLGTANGTPVPVRFNGRVCSLGVKKGFMGMRTTTYITFYANAIGSSYATAREENLITIVYSTTGDDKYTHISFISSLKSDFSKQVPNDIKSVLVFVNDIFGGFVTATATQ